MKTKVLQVFYGADNLPYKDQERTVHFPVIGSGFMGASNTTQIKFYFKEIGDDAVKYVAVSKLPNGKVGSKVLENYFDSELNEPYALLELDSYYTQYKGDLFISLQGYQGGVQVNYNEDTELYEIEGTPTIQATGSIKFTNNYATQFVGSGEEQNITLQQLLAIISDTVLRYYVNSNSTLAEVFDEIGTKICAVDIEGDEYLCEMSGNTNIVLYDIHNQEWYAFSGANTTTIDSVLQDSNKHVIATKEDLENFGNLFTYKGTASVSEINALTDIDNGWCYNLTDSGTLTLGNLSVETGDNVAFNGSVWTKLSSETILGQYYTKQEGQEFEEEIDNRVDAIENQVQQVASGSPKGVYTTLEALQTAYPTGAEGIYVVQADGHWYYWNGSAWADGGVYLAANLTDYISVDEFNEIIFGIENVELPEPINGYYLVGAGNVLSFASDSGSRAYQIDLTDYIGKKVKVLLTNPSNVSGRVTGIGNENQIVETYYAERLMTNDGFVFNVTSDNHILYISYSYGATKVLTVQALLDDSIDGRIDNLDKELDLFGKWSLLEKQNEQEGFFNGTIGNTISYINNAGSKAYTLDLSDYIGQKVNVYFKSTNTTSLRKTAICSSGGTIGNLYNEKDMTDSGFTFDITSTYNVLKISFDGGSTTDLQIALLNTNKHTLSGIALENADKVNRLENDIAVVSATTGSDNNLGTFNSPFLTIEKALKTGYHRVALMSGTYFETIDFNNIVGNEIELLPARKQDKVFIYAPDSILATSETQESGYTKVYKFSCDKTFVANNNSIFQDNVADATTEITDAERHPLQRGKQYRCDDTKIKRCSSATLSDALSEIENASDYRFYVDSDNDLIYFSRPQAVNSTNPICGAFGTQLFSNRDRTKTIKLTGIDFKYVNVDLVGTSNCVITDCSSSNVFGSAAFGCSECLNVKFVRCEASRAFYGGTGDGFNGDCELNYAGYNFQKQLTVELVDCWAHDNNDDGFSTHARAENIVRGGLFEYNGKAGITPSYGTHCSCYDVYSRKNYSGFACVGAATAQEGGKYSQLICYNCVAEDNTRGDAYSQGYGFYTNGAGNKLILIDCKSIGNRIGYFADTNTSIELIDSRALNNTQYDVYGNGTKTIKNTLIDFNSLIDEQGHKRFDKGTITGETISGMTVDVGEWVLNGYQLSIEFDINIANGTTLANQILAYVEIPQWVYDKLTPIWSYWLANYSPNAFDTNGGAQSLGGIYLGKQNNKLQILKSGSVTLSANRFAKIQFDIFVG